MIAKRRGGLMTAIILPMWDGSCLGTGYLAIAVFTVNDPSPGSTPAPVVAAASNGADARVVPPARLGSFLSVHAAAQLVCHDAGELHRVLHDHLPGDGDADARQALWEFTRAGRLHDVQLLDQLVGHLL
jgi:hypothetical protein